MQIPKLNFPKLFLSLLFSSPGVIYLFLLQETNLRFTSIAAECDAVAPFSQISFLVPTNSNDSILCQGRNLMSESFITSISKVWQCDRQLVGKISAVGTLFSTRHL